MKKIIATVLAMVMALALCTVAFAATTATVGEVRKMTDGTMASTPETAPATFIKAEEPVYNADGSVKTKGNLAYYNIDSDHYVVCDKADANYAVYTAKGWVYVKEATDAEVQYEVTATLVGKLDKKCAKLETVTAGEYYTFKNADGDVCYFVEEVSGTRGALVAGEVVLFTTEYEADKLTPNHEWEVASYEDDGLTAATCKCDCGATAKVVTYAEYLAADKKVVDTTTLGDKTIYLVVGAAATKGDATTSPKTFDAGIAMYVGMALTSVAGSAVVIGKKKEF